MTFKTLDKTSFRIFGSVFDANVKAMIQGDLWSFFFDQSSKTRCVSRYYISFGGKPPLFTVLFLNGLSSFQSGVYKTRILDGISTLLQDKKEKLASLSVIRISFCYMLKENSVTADSFKNLFEGL